MSRSTRYLRPSRIMTSVANPMMLGLTRLGVGLRGARELRVRGRTSGEWRTVPVNPLTYEDKRYLVAPRGHTQWVRNLRAAGAGELRLGRKVEPITVEELADDAKPPLLRAYLKVWKMETGHFFGGVDADATDAELRRIAPDHPVFRVHRRTS